MRVAVLLAVTCTGLTLILSACGGGNGSTAVSTPTTTPSSATPSDYPGTTNTVPQTPTTGSSRAGTIYNVFIQSPETGDKVAFTVFEPATVVGVRAIPWSCTATALAAPGRPA